LPDDGTGCHAGCQDGDAQHGDEGQGQGAEGGARHGTAGNATYQAASCHSPRSL